MLRTFAGKTSGEITPGAIETFKSIRLHSVTKRKTKRSPASVRHEIDFLSRIFSLGYQNQVADPEIQVSATRRGTPVVGSMHRQAKALSDDDSVRSWHRGT